MRLNIENKLLYARHYHSMFQLEQGKYPVRDMIRHNLARQIADEIVQKSLHEEERDSSVIFSMEVYVLEPDELHALINQRARELAENYPPTFEE